MIRLLFPIFACPVKDISKKYLALMKKIDGKKRKKKYVFDLFLHKLNSSSV
jgi:hypothetical protein